MKLRFIAKTLPEKTRGLQGSKPLTEDEGALFVYELEDVLEFWNVGVDYPIDIAFFDKNKDIINIETMQSNQSKTVRSRKPAKYVLETKAGFFENKSIKNLNEIINYE